VEQVADAVEPGSASAVRPDPADGGVGGWGDDELEVVGARMWRRPPAGVLEPGGAARPEAEAAWGARQRMDKADRSQSLRWRDKEVKKRMNKKEK
jgi:predicted esterase